MIKRTVWLLLKLPWLVICLLFLGLGFVAQQRLKRALLYPMTVLVIGAVFIILRFFSVPFGTMTFIILLSISYLIYWYDWLSFSGKYNVTRNSLLSAGMFIVVSASSLTALAYYSVSITGYRIYHIPSLSMAPNLLPGDYVLVDLWHYKKRLADKNDIVVFYHPYKKRVYIKRVAKTPNELFLNKKLPAQTYAVFGDNANNSEDSRVFGSIKHASLIGKASYIIFAFDYKNQLNIKRLFYSLK
jgi:signal peptidase I